MSENDLIYEPNLPLLIKSKACYFTGEAFESIKHGFELIKAHLKPKRDKVKRLFSGFKHPVGRVKQQDSLKIYFL
ncbi:hypothetical protein Runsl_0583 [Runella slithyformis DSM 19594]|uniref:Uncharacterized protein n=1 Tax=Runella slithyformis (strain ATCC 29530 / DSM 19594 / LMG 11500 / NCIMB 11436 / LSU 4) TaxID=761193 RepID=A0A7U3ZGY3_RUNSL|nr:hypothetical protein Runsl_0583 [Runella slithyformis DSM 19594]